MCIFRKRLHFICTILGLWFKDTHKARKNFIVKKTGLSVFCTVYIGKPVHTPEAVPVLSRAGNNIHKILWCLVPWWTCCFSGELSCFDFYKFGLVSVCLEGRVLKRLCSQKVSVYLEGCVNLFKTKQQDSQNIQLVCPVRS